jgi:hypothetical protein
MRSGSRLGPKMRITTSKTMPISIGPIPKGMRRMLASGSRPKR